MREEEEGVKRRRGVAVLFLLNLYFVQLLFCGVWVKFKWNQLLLFSLPHSCWLEVVDTERMGEIPFGHLDWDMGQLIAPLPTVNKASGNGRLARYKENNKPTNLY